RLTHVQEMMPSNRRYLWRQPIQGRMMFRLKRRRKLVCLLAVAEIASKHFLSPSFVLATDVLVGFFLAMLIGFVLLRLPLLAAWPSPCWLLQRLAPTQQPAYSR